MAVNRDTAAGIREKKEVLANCYCLTGKLLFTVNTLSSKQLIPSSKIHPSMKPHTPYETTNATIREVMS